MTLEYEGRESEFVAMKLRKACSWWRSLRYGKRLLVVSSCATRDGPVACLRDVDAINAAVLPRAR